jgi:hypothetical protein
MTAPPPSGRASLQPQQVGAAALGAIPQLLLRGPLLLPDPRHTLCLLPVALRGGLARLSSGVGACHYPPFLTRVTQRHTSSPSMHYRLVTIRGARS